MKKIAIFFWSLLVLFIYKLAFLEDNHIDYTQIGHQFTIYRDQEGIPHIFAKNYKDILFGLGYANAQDRLFSLFIKKMLVQGRIAEFFGAEAVLTDLQMRNIGFMNMAKNNIKVTDPNTLELIQCYADGINSFAKNTKMLPYEFYLFWIWYQDWTVENTLAYINFLSFNLEFDWLYQIARQRLLETVGFDLAIKIIPFGSQNSFRNVTILSDQELRQMGRYKQYNYQRQKEIIRQHWLSNNFSIGSLHFPGLQFSVPGSGSNAWVIGGQHTQNGKPLLANDPHLASMIPSLFYCHQVVLIDQDGNVKNRKFGAMADGLPSVSIGISNDYAWASTAAYIDNKDVYYQTIRNNSGKMQYKFKDDWFDFIQRKEIIKVRGDNDIEEIFYHTHRGVVLQTIFMEMHWKYGFPLPQKYRDNHTITLNAIHYQPDNSSAKGHIQLITSENFQEFFIATKLIQHPNVDTLYILKNKTYGYNSVGSIPLRKIPQMGSFIKDGNLDYYDIAEILQDKYEPFLSNPQKGYFTMANNKFASDNFEFRSSIHEIITGRSFRLDNLVRDKIAKGDKFNINTMIEMQLDYKDDFIAEVLPNLLKKLKQYENIWQSQKHSQIWLKLFNWNYTLTKESIQASLYHVWEYLFQKSLFRNVYLQQEQIEAIINHGYFQNYQFLLFQKIGKGQLTSEEQIVCQNDKTKNLRQLHPCQASAVLAFKQLPKELGRLFESDDLNDYKWGQIHQQHFKIIPYEKIPILNKIWQRNFPTGGNSRTLNVAVLTHQSKTYNSIGTPVFRIVTDLEQTYFSLEVGESDRIFSPFYDNFVGKDKYVKYVRYNPRIDNELKGWSISAKSNKI